MNASPSSLSQVKSNDRSRPPDTTARVIALIAVFGATVAVNAAHNAQEIVGIQETQIQLLREALQERQDPHSSSIKPNNYGSLFVQAGNKIISAQDDRPFRLNDIARMPSTERGILFEDSSCAAQVSAISSNRRPIKI